MKHCPICGKSSDQVAFFGEFCEECLSRKLDQNLKGEAEVPLCRDCGRIEVRGKFVPISDESVEELLKSRYKRYVIRLIHFAHGIARMRVKDEKQEDLRIYKNVHLKFVKILCDNDSKKRAGYYESIVQLRGYNKEKVRNLAGSLIKYLEKYDAFVTKIDERDHGVDLYTSNKEVTVSFITVRHLKWKGSFELYGLKSGKRVYRNTYFITLD